MIRVRQIKIPILEDTYENKINKIAKKLRINTSDIYDIKIRKKSIDARNNNIMIIYEIDVTCKEEDKILRKNKSIDIFKSIKEEYKIEITGKEKLKYRPIIVGSGPAGLFCAYILAELRYNPIIIERGEKIEDRVKTVEHFFKTGELNKNSNVQFGEGGAGTFSDGKLNTLTKDKSNRILKVFETFVEHGASEDILIDNKPHIGTDVLRSIIINMRNKIISLGGEFIYNSRVTDLIIEDGSIKGVEINKEKQLLSDIVVLAIGHSARDTYRLLREKNIEMRKKNFAVGVRVEHKKEMIDKNLYHDYYKLLPPASYKLTYQTKSNRGVYSFCMCPGGFVINASTEDDGLVINGMSNKKRDEENSNSAIVVTVGEKDLDDDLFSGIEFQRKLEKRAYQEGMGKIPVQTLKDFKLNKETTSLGSVIPNTKGAYKLSNLNNVLPGFVIESIKEALPVFGKKIKGFDKDDTIILGVETRTSSPLVIVRDKDMTSSVKGLYPAGEGAGYAGGITTSAIDGIKVAEKIIAKYNNK